MDKSLIWIDYLFLFCCRVGREVAEGLERRRREMSVSSWNPIRAVSNPAVNESRMMERSVQKVERGVEMEMEESAIWITSFQFTLIIISKFTRTHA